jgi:hypothetical protein
MVLDPAANATVDPQKPAIEGQAEMSTLGLTILFDGLDRLIFPFRMWLFAPTKPRIHLTMLADGGGTGRTGDG